MLKVKLFLKLFGLITDPFNYTAPHILIDVTVIMKIMLTYPRVAINCQMFIEHPEIELI